MGIIRLLPDDVASQVAAGEVVERPASVVKELVENSIDAGACSVKIEFHRGGASLVRVGDDGCGMERDDVLMSLERHATSKIRTASDLASVATMGFRGEAVPSIAAVSRFRIATRPRGGACGTEVRVAGGRVESVADSGCAEGTTVEAASLFFNLPARRKFLRGEETESAHIVQQTRAAALARPEVAFTLLRDGRLLWRVPASDSLAVRVRDLLGAPFIERLLPLEPVEFHGIRLEGFLAKPGEGRPDREQQFVLLNRRIIQSNEISRALREAYAGALPGGRNPLAVLRITMDPGSFDCNVHPAKREVRLHRPDLVRQAVYMAASALLEPPRRVPRAATGHPDVEPPPPPTPPPFAPAPRPIEFRGGGDSGMALPVEPPERQDESGSGRFRLVGDLAGRWLLMEGAEGLVLLDVQAASERILFEKLRREAAGGEGSSQRLLLPCVVELTERDAVWIRENIDALRASGFLLEPFGGTSFKVEGLPPCLGDREAADAILEVCATLRDSGMLGSGGPALDAIARSVSRVGAIRRLDFEKSNATRLVDGLLRCELPYACPRGRPTMIQWSFAELDRKFGG